MTNLINHLKSIEKDILLGVNQILFIQPIEVRRYDLFDT